MRRSEIEGFVVAFMNIPHVAVVLCITTWQKVPPSRCKVTRRLLGVLSEDERSQANLGLQGVHLILNVVLIITR